MRLRSTLCASLALACSVGADALAPHDGSLAEGADAGSPPSPPARAQCSATLEKLAEFRNGVSGLLVERDAIYVLADALYRIPHEGGAAVPLAPLLPGRSAGTNLVGDAERLFWNAREGTGASSVIAIMSLSRTGGSGQQRLFGAQYLGWLRGAGEQLFFGVRDGPGSAPRLRRIPKEGGAVVDIVASPITGVAVDGEYLYWSTGSEIRRVLLHEGGLGEQVRTTHGSMIVVAADATHIFGFASDRREEVLRTPRAGGAAEMIVTLDSSYSPVFAVDGAFLYWADATGVVARIPKSGGEIVRLGALGGYDDDDYTAVLAFDESSVYFQAGPPPPMPGVRTASDGDPLWLARVCK